MTKRTILTALLIAVLSVSSAAAQTVDPVVVRVGTIEYRQSEVQAYWDSLAEYTIAAGEAMDASGASIYAESVVESYVGMGVIENKLVEYGLDRLTAEDEAALAADAQKLYNDALELYTQRVMSQYNRTHDEAEPYAQTFMELDGYTMQEAQAQALRNFKEERILNYVSSDVAALTDDELQAYYEQNLVQPSEQAYANDREAFENDVLLYGGTTYYIPEGYRYVRHIFLPSSDETVAKAVELEEQLKTAQADRQTAENKLYAAQLLSENVAQAETALNEAETLCGELQAQLDATYAETLTTYAEQLADIQTRLAAGESFTALMKEYSQDELMPEEGFMVSAESVLWESSFQQGAMSLNMIGEVSEPIATKSGVHIMEYAGDAPSGAIPLEGDLKQTVADAALLERKYNALTACVLQWRGEYEIETHPALLSTPECLSAQ